MSAETDRIAELEQDVVDLMEDVERYRTAAEDSMHLLDWCIGYFSGSKNAHVAMSSVPTGQRFAVSTCSGRPKKHPTRKLLPIKSASACTCPQLYATPARSLR